MTTQSKREYKRLWQREWVKNPKNKRTMKLACKRWRKNNTEQQIAYRQQYHLEHGAERRKHLSESNALLRSKTLDLYGGKCVRCGFKDHRFLDFDHIDNDGKEQRKVLGWKYKFYNYLIENKPDDIQILCSWCNRRKMRHGTYDWGVRKQRGIAIIRSRTQQRRLKCLKHYGTSIPHCKLCGLVNTRFLHLDHIDDNGKEEREKYGQGDTFYKYLIENDFPSNLQVLCRKCNLDKQKT